MQDSVGKTIGVSAALCIVCSIMVSTAAVVLKPKQEENKALDLKKNMLASAGLVSSTATKAEIEEAYQKIEAKVVELKTGEYAEDINAEEYDQRAAEKDPEMSTTLPGAQDIAKIRNLEKYSKVFLVKEGGSVSQIILPFRGKGLWSTMRGFVSLKPDTKTVNGMSFYEHAETPGLGGEIDNPRWKAQWEGKELLGDNYKPKFSLVKGGVTNTTPEAEHKVDSLSGATLTAVGVENAVKFWFGDQGFGPYLKKFRDQNK